MDLKRKASEMAIVAVKRAKSDIVLSGGAVIPGRTSQLNSQIMLLTGHDGEIFSSKFSPEGDMIASGGADRQIMLWSVYGECENFHTMKGHSGAILDLKFTVDGYTLVSCSTDKTLGLWDMSCGMRIKRFKGHQSFVNACEVARKGTPLICSGSDDGTIKIWDQRNKQPVQAFQSTYQVLTVAFNDSSELVFSGGIDNDIKVWDLRKQDLLYRLKGHQDSVTGIELSPDGSYLLSTSMDNTVRMWDIRPYAPLERQMKTFTGSQHTFEKNLLRVAWSSDGNRVAAGSGDRFVYIWDVSTRRLAYKLPGHQGSVNDVDFHPVEPIVLSCSSDKKIYLGEIEAT